MLSFKRRNLNLSEDTGSKQSLNNKNEQVPWEQRRGILARVSGETSQERGHKRWARSYGVEDIPCRQLHEQSMSTYECRKHLEVSDPAHTRSGREYGWDVVSLEELYASESASSSSLEALPEPAQEDKQKTWAWASLHPWSQTVALFHLFIFEVFTLTFHLKNEFYFF